MTRTVKCHADKYKDLIENITQNGIPQSAQIIYSGRNNVYTLTADDGTVINIKSFHKPKFPNNYIYTNFRPSKAERSYLHAKRLLSMGILTPEPFGWGEVKEGGELKESYYFCRQVPFQNVRNWQDIPDYELMLKALGKDIVKFFKNGVLHKDFTAGNILFEPIGEGNYNFYYIDLNRLDFNVHSHCKLMSMFRGIHPEKEQVAKLAEYFAKAANLDAEKTVREALHQVDVLIKTKRRHNALKKLFK